MGLKDYKFYRDLKTLKRLIRENVIRVMPREHRYPDAIFLKEHIGMVVHYTAAMYVNDDLNEKARLANSILFEMYVIQDEIEEQTESKVLSLKQAAVIYAKIQDINQSILRFKNFLLNKRESDGARSSESAVK